MFTKDTNSSLEKKKKQNNHADRGTLTHNPDTERHEQQQNCLSLSFSAPLSTSLPHTHTHIHECQLNKLSMKTGSVAMETTGL